MQIGLVTIVHGRHEHLRRQHAAVARMRTPPMAHVAVAMDDPDVPQLAGLHIEDLPGGGELPLARARNLGARAALDAGADGLVFLDADCVPGQGMIVAYARALAQPSKRLRLVCGPVGYLPRLAADAAYDDAELAAVAREHPARAELSRGEVRDVNLFWSLSFAATADDWRALGGFCESYVGYGAEDTDLAQILRSRNGALVWEPQAVAYHQHHEGHDPPTDNLRGVVRNANLFRRRWGWFPMAGWLEQFERRGLARRDAVTGEYRVAADSRPQSS